MVAISLITSGMIAPRQKIQLPNPRSDATKNASIGATSWEICHLKIPHTFHMEKPFKNMALKLTSQEIGGQSHTNVRHKQVIIHNNLFLFMNITQHEC